MSSGCFWVEQFSQEISLIYCHHSCCMMKIIFLLHKRNIHLYLSHIITKKIFYIMTPTFLYSSRNAVFARKVVLQLDVLHLDVNEVTISHVDFRENVFFNSLAILRKLSVEYER